MRPRTFVLATHRWLGLTVSLILAVTGGTGSIMVWPGEHLLKRVAGKLHENLAMGQPGSRVVLAATAAAVLLELTGLYLWWRRRTLTVSWRSGWRGVVLDLHHAAGVVGLAVMLTLAVSAVGMRFGSRATRSVLAPIHTADAFTLPMKVVFALGSFGFVIQGGTGILMWLKRRQRIGPFSRGNGSY